MECENANLGEPENPLRTTLKSFYFKGDSLCEFNREFCRTRVVFPTGDHRNARLHLQDISIHASHEPQSMRSYTYPLFSLDFGNRRSFINERPDNSNLEESKSAKTRFEICGSPARPVSQNVQELSRCQRSFAFLQEMMGMGFEYTHLGQIYYSVLKNDMNDMVGFFGSMSPDFVVEARTEAHLVDSIRSNGQQSDYKEIYGRFVGLSRHKGLNTLSCLEDLSRLVNEVTRRIWINDSINEYSSVFQLNNYLRKRVHEFLEFVFKQLVLQSYEDNTSEVYLFQSLYVQNGFVDVNSRFIVNWQYGCTQGICDGVAELLKEFIKMVGFLDYSITTAAWSEPLSSYWPLHNIAEPSWMKLGCREPAAFFSRAFQFALRRTEVDFDNYRVSTADGLVLNSSAYSAPFPINNPEFWASLPMRSLKNRVASFRFWNEGVPLSLKTGDMKYSWDTNCVSIHPLTYGSDQVLFANPGYSNFPVPATHVGNRQLSMSEYSSSLERMDFVLEVGNMDVFELDELKTQLKYSRNSELVSQEKIATLSQELSDSKENESNLSAECQAHIYENHGLKQDLRIRGKELVNARKESSMEYNEVNVKQFSELEKRVEATGSVYDECGTCSSVILPSRGVILHCQSSETSGLLVGHLSCAECFYKDCQLKLAEFESSRPHGDPRERKFQYLCPYDKLPVTSISIAFDSKLCPVFQRRLASFLKSPKQELSRLDKNHKSASEEIQDCIREIANPVTNEQRAAFGPVFESTIIANQQMAAGFSSTLRHFRSVIRSARGSTRALVRAYEIGLTVPGLLDGSVVEENSGAEEDVELPEVSNQEVDDVSMD